MIYRIFKRGHSSFNFISSASLWILMYSFSTFSNGVVYCGYNCLLMSPKFKVLEPFFLKTRLIVNAESVFTIVLILNIISKIFHYIQSQIEMTDQFFFSFYNFKRFSSGLCFMFKIYCTLNWEYFRQNTSPAMLTNFKFFRHIYQIKHIQFIKDKIQTVFI